LPGRSPLPLLLLAACSPGQSTPPLAAVRDSAGLVIVENDLERLRATCRVDSTPVVRIGVAEGDEVHELYRVFGATRLSDGRIVLVNQGTQEIRSYDREGRFLQRAGRAGQGPGEFSDAFQIWPLPGDTVYVGDSRPWQFLVFDPEGRWVRTVRPEPFYANPPEITLVLDDGRLVLAERPLRTMVSNFGLMQLTVVVHAPDGTLVDTIGTYPAGRWGRVGSNPAEPFLFPLFESFTRVTAGGSRIVLGHGSRTELQLLRAGERIRLERLVRWTVGDRRVTGADIEAERRRLEEQYRDMPPDRRALLVDPLVSDRRPVADEFPAFSRIVLGRDGRIWVQEYRRPRDPETQRWVVFDAQGRAQCRATVPTRGRLLEAGGDYVLTMDPDEDDVERVSLFTLAGPAGR
jgi:hypothetical protein